MSTRRSKKIIVDQQGDGLIGDIIDKILPTRKNFPPKTRTALKDYGNKVITGIVVGRSPIQSYVTKLLNWLSLGKFEEQQKKLNYDNVYHLFMIVYLEGSIQLVVEKTPVIEIRRVNNYEGKDMMSVSLGSKKITLAELMANTVNKVGPSLYLYDHVNNNCQVFLKNILSSNGLLTTSLGNFIMQDVETLLKTSPGYTNAIARIVTEGKAKLDRLIEGEGKKKSTPRKRVVKRKIINI